MGTYHFTALGLFLAFCLLDLVARARRVPDVAYWWLKGAAATALYFSVAAFAHGASASLDPMLRGEVIA